MNESLREIIIVRKALDAIQTWALAGLLVGFVTVCFNFIKAVHPAVVILEAGIAFIASLAILITIYIEYCISQEKESGKLLDWLVDECRKTAEMKNQKIKRKHRIDLII